MISTKEGVIRYSKAGIGKTRMSILRMFILGFMAGFFVAVSGLASTAATVSFNSVSIVKIVTALIFPIGLVMVVTNGAELFTGNNLIIISVLNKRVKLRHMFKNWIVVYTGNIVGSLFFTIICTWGNVYSMFEHELAKSVLTTATMKCNLSFSEAFVKGILCNVLVCAAIMMSMMVNTMPGRIMVLYLPIMVFVLCGFEHSVANMSFISGGLFVNSAYGNLGVDVSGLTWHNFFVSNLFPVTLGNIVGGSALGTMYWFAYEKEAK